MEDFKKVSDFGPSDYDLYLIQPLSSFGQPKNDTAKRYDKIIYKFNRLDSKEGPPIRGIGVA